MKFRQHQTVLDDGRFDEGLFLRAATLDLMLPAPVAALAGKEVGYAFGNAAFELQDVSEITTFGVKQTFDTPIRLVKMGTVSEGRLWMSDAPQERMDMRVAADAIEKHEDVLVGGLGLSVLPQMLRSDGHHGRIMVIEIDEDVAEAWGPVMEELKVEIIVGDVQEYLEEKTPLDTWDVVYLDTWDKPDYEYLPTVNGMLDNAKHHLKPNGRVMAWAYIQMLGQAMRDARHSAPLFADFDLGHPKLEGMKKRWPLLGRIAAAMIEAGALAGNEMDDIAVEIASTTADTEIRPLTDSYQEMVKARAELMEMTG